MIPPLLAIAGAAILLFAWAGPLPSLVPGSFAAHMMLHMTVVGIGVPVLAFGVAPWLTRRGPLVWPMVLPIAASLLDLVVVWLWHLPALHHASRVEPFALGLEQLSFAAVALLVWLVALTGPPLAGALALFFTSMHMTLLGALLGLASRVIYDGHGVGSWLRLLPLADQQAGGVIMLAIGGVIYLGGGLWLVARVLRPVRA
jgi:putative membrane protein